MDELLLIALQWYEEPDKQNGIIDKQSVLECEQDGECSDSEDDSETEMDELLLMASQRYEEQDEQNGIADQCKINCVLKETVSSILECEQDSERIETMEIDELVLMASQQYEE